MSDILVKFDYETRSGKDLGDVGRVAYLRHPLAAILMMSYKIGTAPTHLWEPGMALPDCFKDPTGYVYMAMNIQFDQLVMNTLGRRHGFLFLQRDKCIDLMAIAARYGLPQSLDKLGKMLKVKMQKMIHGTLLKNKICSPPFEYTPAEWAEFKEYCIRDTDSMDEIVSKLPSDHLSAKEQAIWEDTATINIRGVSVDAQSVGRVRKVVDYYLDREMKRVPKITLGAVNTIHQRVKIIEWCATKGVHLDNIQAITVDEKVKELKTMLAEHHQESEHLQYNDHKEVLKLLCLRQLIGGAAVKKFRRLDDMVVDGRIHDNLRYHGASTGRTTGGGFQMLNMPRAKVKPNKKNGETYDEAVNDLLKKFYNTTILQHENPMGEAKKLVRPMLKASKRKVLMAADWGSIEYILLMCFAGEWDKVEKFRGGNDPYIDFATELFGVAYDDVTDDQRQESKPPVLGSGYMLGSGVPRRDPPGGLIAYALGYGVAMTDEQAQFATDTYRGSHQNVVQSWYALRKSAVSAITHPGQEFTASILDGQHSLRTKFIVAKDRTGRPWLVMTLPSGRSLYYCQPRLVKNDWKVDIKHMGVDPITKQWVEVFLKPQRIIENIIQGLGRCILQEALPRLNEAKFNVVAHVYDEVLCEEPDEDLHVRFRLMRNLMCRPPVWMPQLPLRADGWIGKCYRKD